MNALNSVQSNIYILQITIQHLVRYIHPADHNTARVRKVDLFQDELHIEDKKFPVRIKDAYKIEKKNSIGISVFGYENKIKHPIYVSQNASKKNMWMY